MKKILGAIFCGMCLATSGAYADDILPYDTSDPLYILNEKHILSQTTLAYWDSILRGGETLSYGITDRLSISGNIHYQVDFDGKEDGFSSFDVGGTYRLSTPSDNDVRIISDVLLGLKFGGSSHVRTPEYADSVYYAGLRFGRQWTGMTLAMTVKSSWIFDDTRGMAFIDFMPEAYFRLDEYWRIGPNFIWRKATNPHYDQEWLGGKIVRQFGRTQYIGHVDYEFESDDLQVGFKLNILF